jgi:hypothetical protein
MDFLDASIIMMMVSQGSLIITFWLMNARINKLYAWVWELDVIVKGKK